jgi:hypothetical protein
VFSYLVLSGLGVRLISVWEVLGGGLSGIAIRRSRCRVGRGVGSSPGAFRLRADFEVDEEAPSSYRQRMDGFASFDRI